MGLLTKYIGFAAQRRANLDNVIERSSCKESEEEMSVNKYKIRREVVIDGKHMWVSANSEQEYADKVLNLSSGFKLPAKKHNFRDYAERWYEVFSKPNIAHVTQLTYERQLNSYIFPVLENLDLEDIGVEDVQRVFNLKTAVKQETKNKIKIVLNQIFEMAVEEDLIRKNPLRSKNLKIKGEPSTETEPYDVWQMQYLFSHLNDIPNVTDRGWLALSIALPLRPEEVLGLRWGDLDEETCRLHVRNTVTHPTRNQPEFKPYAKNASSIRELIVSKEILDYLPERGDDDEFIIGGAMPITYTGLRWIRKRVEKYTGFGETILPRRFRTTVATDISAETHDLKLVQRMLGHSTPQMTLKYYDKGRNKAADASEAIGKCYGFSRS